MCDDVHGDVIDLVEQKNGLSKREAIAFLKKRAGLVDMPRALPSLNEKVLRAQEKLKTSENAQKYLASRGFNKETIERLKLGFDDGAIFGPRFKNMIIFPYLDNGKTVYVKGSTIEKDAEGKRRHENIGGTIPRLFNEDVLKGAGEVILSEGETDAITLVQEGFPAVGVPGVQGFKKEWVSKFGGKKVFICFDGDEAGLSHRQNLLALLREAGVESHPVNLPEGIKDINQLYLKNKVEFPKTVSFLIVEALAKRTSDESKTCPTTIYLEDLKNRFKKWLHLNDDEIIDILLATVLTNKFSGDPVWLFVIAPPGGTKTELLRAFTGEGFYTVSTLTPHSLISGLKTQAHDVDLLPQLNGKVLIIKDLTPILTMGDDDRNQIFSDLRDAYDGYVEKVFGSGVGKKGYRAHFGLIAGVTPAIDMYSSIHSLLGERFLKLRVRTDPSESVKRAYKNAGREEQMRKELQEAVSGFLMYLKSQNLDISNFSISQDIEDKIIALSIILATVRSPVTRDRNKVVRFIPEPEIATRLLKQLKKLIMALALVRGRKEATEGDYETVKRVAMDSAPERRLKALFAFKSLNATFVPTKDIGEQAKLPTTSANEVLEDLWMLQLIRRQQHGGSYEWSIKDKTLTHLNTCDLVGPTIEDEEEEETDEPF